MPEYLSPGVYIEEIPSGARPIEAVDTSLTALIGYTEKGALLAPTLITSLAEYAREFGGPAAPAIEITESVGGLKAKVRRHSQFYLYDAVAQFFANGGSRCVIVSVGDYGPADAPTKKRRKVLRSGLKALNTQGDIRLVVIPDAVLLSRKNYARLLTATLNHCETRGDRFAILDVHKGHKAMDGDPDHDVISGAQTGFRSMVAGRDVSFGAAYYPWIELRQSGPVPSPGFRLDDASIAILRRAVVAEGSGSEAAVDGLGAASERVRKESHDTLLGASDLYRSILASLPAPSLLFPPSASIAGVMAQTDATRGVWKAPAGLEVRNIAGFAQNLTDAAEVVLNPPGSAVHVNSLRTFEGRGHLVWGARTLDGGDTDYRYVSVRRVALMLQTSITAGLQWVVFEPNDEPLWKSVRRDVSAFLDQMFRSGALQGTRQEEAFYVRVGLGETMTQSDLDNGRLVCEVGVAPLRPAEFVILRFMLKMSPT